eukprot:m.71548 g.71548  ORF g.71548 m.71548 type:complete len:1135 (+) comp12954_c0_seq1:1094-4498(+)
MEERGRGSIDSSRCPSAIDSIPVAAASIPAAITEEGSPVDRRIADVVVKHAEMMHHLLESEALESLESIAAQQRSRAAALRKESSDLKDEESAKVVPGTFLLNGPEDFESWGKSPRVKLLIIARQKKVSAKPMQKILEQFVQFSEFDIGLLSEHMLFNVPIEGWPRCQCLIAFQSSGYPLEKVDRYAQLVRPFMVNDVSMQKLLLDRRDVFRVLRENGIPVPPHMIVSRDQGAQPVLIEREDVIICGDQSIQKPFVEKPVNADNHEIYVYFASSDGGGAQYLFRKAQDRSSEFLPDLNNVHQDGSYIYEEFVPTGGTDIKVYTVGATYAHAEGRKSPVVDGKVLRDHSGKEVRCPIMLNAFEKEIAAKVVKAFKQNVCGFDLLRTQGKSYVCDVNGWSFVKRAPKYYTDCAHLLRTIMLEAVAPALLRRERLQRPLQPALHVLQPRTRSGDVELRCVIAVVRHGDRTPKQKMKMRLQRGSEFLALFERFATDFKQELKLKTKPQLECVLSTARAVLARPRAPEDEEDYERVQQIEQVLNRSPIIGINRKVQLKPLAWETVNDREAVTEAQLILKWGGELTEDWFTVSEEAGHFFRENMYPSSQESGLLRLHSTYRHDLKMYSSDEGRVQMTAASFAKGLLDLEGDLPPILVSLVRKDKAANTLLDDTSAARRIMDQVKQRLHTLLSTDAPMAELAEQLDALATPAIQRSLAIIDNPRVALRRLYATLIKLVERIRALPPDTPPLSEDESVKLFLYRWEKLEKDFYNKKKDHFDVSKIPDIYDQLKYDVYHNSHLDLPEIKEMFLLAQALADVTVVQEYGITRAEKLEIGAKIAKPLVEKLVHDLRIAAGKISKHVDFQNEITHRLHRVGEGYESIGNVKSPGRHVRTRLYFTSESHIHSLFNLLRYGDYSNGTATPPSRRQSFSTSVPGPAGMTVSALPPPIGTPMPTPMSTTFSTPVMTPTQPFPPTLSQLPPGPAAAAAAATAVGEKEHGETPPPPLAGPEVAALLRSPVGLRAILSSPFTSLVDGEAREAARETARDFSSTYFANLTELNYLTHIVCRLYERPDLPEGSDDKYFVEWLFTPGMTLCNPGQPYTPDVAPFVRLHTPMPLAKVEKFFESVIEMSSSGLESPAL